MRCTVGALAIGSLAAIAVTAACLPGSGPLRNVHVDDAGSPPTSLDVGDATTLRADVDLGDPFAITGLLPSHGPFAGGTRTSVAGRGFSSSIEVWIGSTQLAASDVFANSPTRASVVTPPGSPGAAAVRVRNVVSGQERTLAAGFFYDALVVSPGSGATTGGTLVDVRGSGTAWAPTSVVSIGGRPCAALTVVDAAHLTCTTPPGSPGSTDVTVTGADGGLDQARDAFTYSDSPDGYRGGLYGGALSGALEVIAFDAWTGTPLAGGRAIAGSSLASSVVGTLDASGVAWLRSPSLSGKATVTVAAKCHQPMTFVDVPVDTVTAYLYPVLDVSCAGDPSSSGNYYPVRPGEVHGELVWTGGIEFELAPWSSVPAPAGNEQMAAYVFAAGGSPLDPFQLPPTTSATTPSARGVRGYTYGLTALPGNQTLYAIAGLEDRTVTPPRFVPYAMGVARGVLVQPGAKTIGVDIPMTTVFDHAMQALPRPPPRAPEGPDRLVSTLAIDLGGGLYALLPQGTVTTPLPVAGGVSWVGVPSLDGTLSTAAYDVTGAAVTGNAGGPPLSVVARVETTDANDPLTLGGFFGIPTPLAPSVGAWNGTHVAMQAGGAIDLVVVSVTSGDGLVTWTIVAPGTDLSFDLPDLAQVPGVGSLVRGSIVTTFAIARMNSFDYGRLRYGQLSSRAWSAYAQNTSAGSY